jgi:hypothetical protein
MRVFLPDDLAATTGAASSPDRSGFGVHDGVIVATGLQRVNFATGVCGGAREFGRYGLEL